MGICAYPSVQRFFSECANEFSRFGGLEVLPCCPRPRTQRVCVAVEDKVPVATEKSEMLESFGLWRRRRPLILVKY